MASLQELPHDALHRILAALDSKSLALASCVSLELQARASQPALWRSHCCLRWRRQDTDLWRRLASRGQYAQLYARKHALDASARELVLRLADEQRAPATLTALWQLGEDVLDALTEDALAGEAAGPAARWAREAMLHLQARLASQEMSSLVYRQGGRLDACLDEGCLLLAQCHYPLSDLSPIPRFFDSLAAELRARMAAAGASGGLPALKLLSQLLFAQPDGGGEDAAAAAAAAADERDRWWLPEASEIRPFGPEQAAQLSVPGPGESLGLRGNREAYGDPGNSLLPAVLLTGRGIPLSLCVIHAAVGQRAGLAITGVNMPIHFINRYESLDGKEWFVDCFNGGRILTREEVPQVMLGTDAYLQHRLQHDPRIFAPAAPKDVWIRAVSNMQNAYAGLPLQQPPRSLALCNLLMCGVLRTFTRQPYFVQQELVTRYAQRTWADWQALLPWVLPGSLSLAPRDMNESLR